MLAREEGERVGWIGSLVLVDENCCIWSGQAMGSYCKAKGTIYLITWWNMMADNVRKRMYIYLYLGHFAVQWQKTKSIIIKKFFYLLFCLLRAAPVAYGGPQTRDLIRAVAAGLCQSHSNTTSELRLRPTPQLTAMTDPLTHWARPRIKPTTSWMLVRFVNFWATMGTLSLLTLYSASSSMLLNPSIWIFQLSYCILYLQNLFVDILILFMHHFSDFV